MQRSATGIDLDDDIGRWVGIKIERPFADHASGVPDVITAVRFCSLVALLPPPRRGSVALNAYGKFFADNLNQSFDESCVSFVIGQRAHDFEPSTGVIN